MKIEIIRIPIPKVKIFKDIKIYHLIAATLPLPLITQMFNTSNLYYKYSHLVGHEKVMGAYFVGICLEWSIFVCILAGSRAAGAWFAIVSFFVGILFHDNWDVFLVDLPNMNDLVHITFHKEFYATTLLQLANSILGWFLSELYIEKRAQAQKAAGIKQSIIDEQQILAGIQQDIADSMQELAGIQQKTAAGKQELTGLHQKITEGKQELTDQKQKFTDLEYSSEALKQDIVSLQKQKAAHSRGVAQNNNH